MEIDALVKVIAKAAGEKKAERMTAQDLRGISSLCDFQFICSGTNERQTQAICSHIEDTLREQISVKPLAIEGKQTGNWILMDYGDVMVHIFLDSLREYYSLERLWPKAAVTPLEA